MYYKNLYERLAEQYDLPKLYLMESEQIETNIKDGKKKMRAKIDKAMKKQGFSNTEVARVLQKETLYDLVNIAGAELIWIYLRDKGYRISDHKLMLRHFADCWTSLLDIKDQPKPDDESLLIHINEWVYIGLSKMMDASAMPKSNDYQIKKAKMDRRRFDEADDVRPRPSIQHICKSIGQMILFQTRMKFYNELFPLWFEKTKERHEKGGRVGLNYFVRDFTHSMDDLYASLKVKSAGEDDDELKLKLELLASFERLPILESGDFTIILGSWIFNLIYKNLPIFKQTKEQFKGTCKLEFIDDNEELRSAWGQTLSGAYVVRPMLAPPLEMTVDKRGGNLHQAHLKIQRGHNGKLNIGETRLNFLNTQALVPFKINQWTFEVMKTIVESGANHKLDNFCYYTAHELPYPSDLLEGKPKEYYRWDEKEKWRWACKQPEWRNVKRQVSKMKTAQIKAKEESTPSKEIYHSAEEFIHAEAIWFPVQPEFRGRLLTNSTFLTYQGRDSAKGLIKLAQPVSIVGKEYETRFWIANHLASTYGNNLDKQPFSKRINAVEADEFQSMIECVATMVDRDFKAGLDILKGCDKPFMFASACREWYELFIKQSKTETDLLVGNDCSCSGQQFASAWRKHKNLAEATNVIPNSVPQDLYLRVWENLSERIESVLSRRHERSLRLDGYGRAICKAGIQPSSYGSGEKTSLQSIRKKMEKLKENGDICLTEKEMEAILANYIPALNEVSEMNTMNKWMRKFATKVHDTGVDKIVVPTPCGDSYEIHYYGTDSYRIDTYRYGSINYRKPLAQRTTMQLLKPNGEPQADRWKTGLTANVTHGAGDASLLALAFHNCPYHFATNHDAVYVPAPFMNDARDRMRKAFLQVASFEMFDELQQANGVFIEPGEVPNPVVGDWDDVEQVLESEYFLS